MRFFEQAMQDNGIPEKVTMNKSGANKAAIDQIIEDQNLSIPVRQVKYLNNIVEQDHRAVKRVARIMLGFNAFKSAKSVIAGIELMRMIRKGQLMMEGCREMSFADQFYALAVPIRPRKGMVRSCAFSRFFHVNATEPFDVRINICVDYYA